MMYELIRVLYNQPFNRNVRGVVEVEGSSFQSAEMQKIARLALAERQTDVYWELTKRKSLELLAAKYRLRKVPSDDELQQDDIDV